MLWNRATGEAEPVELFVGVWGASNFVYVEACPAQDLASWIAAHMRMLEAFGAVPPPPCPTIWAVA